MAAYDPKRPRPAELRDEPAPVDALLEPAAPTPPAAPATPESPPLSASPSVTDPPAVEVIGSGPNGTEVPVAPAPEVGTANRAVLYAALGVGAVAAVVLLLLRRRSRRGAGDHG